VLSTDRMAEFSRADLLALFQRAQGQFTDRVDAVPPGRWDERALPGWSVADLVAHLTAEQLWVPPLLAGEPLAAVAPRIPTSTDVLLGAHPLTAWETAADAALTAWAVDDEPDRTVDLSRGPTPASEYLAELTADLTVHAWDLARAVGGVTALDPDLDRGPAVRRGTARGRRHPRPDRPAGLRSGRRRPADPAAGPVRPTGVMKVAASRATQE
jgi:uncharacterized protein (TIGR03086 family)